MFREDRPHCCDRGMQPGFAVFVGVCHLGSRPRRDDPSGSRYSAGPGADCSGYARAVEQAGEWLEHIRRWQQRVDEAAGEFRGPAGAFWDLLQNDLPRAESLLLALIGDLEAARRVQAGAS